MTFTKAELTRIIESADEVITALAGTNDDIHPDNSTKMCAAWDDLNDRNAPPSVVKRLAELALAGMEAEPVACPKCNDTGMADSGGVQPWGDGILVPCDCSLPDPELTLLIHDLNIDGNHRLANVIQDLIEVKKAAPQPLTTSERSELENYRNAQQVVPDELANKSFEYIANKFQVPISDAQWILVGWNACRAAMLQGAEPVSNRDELPIDYLQGHKDGLEWAALLAEANHLQTGDWLYDDPLELAKAIRKGPDMPGSDGNSPVIPDGWVACSERMPDVGDIVLTAKDGFVNVGEMERSGANYRFFTSIASGRELPATHWQPLPAAPQQEAE